jgi:hypothetical protein
VKRALLAAGLFAAASTASATPADEFFAGLKALCGQSFVGRSVADEGATGPNPFEGARIATTVQCDGDTVRMPVTVGDDTSRTWVVTNDPLTLRHDHRHADGTPDAVTQYGGAASARGTAQRQEFPADAASRAMFEREGLAVSTSNVWTLEIGPVLVYELNRPGRHFRLEFTPAP